MGVCVRLFSPTNEDTHLTFHLGNEDTQKTEDVLGFSKLAERESYTAQTCIWGVGPPLAVICQDPRCGG